MGQSEDNAWLRKTAQLRLMQLDALDQIDSLERIVQEFERRTGALPNTWQALVGAGVLRGVPVDPALAPYLLDVRTGLVSVDESSPLHPLPTEPAAAPELRGR